MKENNPQLIVMLTHSDMTVSNAEEVFEECRNSSAVYWGFKEKPLSPERVKNLCLRMKECGKKTGFEGVVYSEKESLETAKLAASCGFDMLLGTMFCDSVCRFCRENGLEYYPFIGKVSGRPSVLEGGIDDMIHEAKECLSRGASGIDLLGYRYMGNAVELNRRVCSETDGPVCIAGSVNSYERLAEVKESGAKFFTIGSAFFEGLFGGTITEQINKVCAFMSGNKTGTKE